MAILRKQMTFGSEKVFSTGKLPFMLLKSAISDRDYFLQNIRDLPLSALSIINAEEPHRR